MKDTTLIQRLLSDASIQPDDTLDTLMQELRMELQKPASEQDLDLIQEIDQYIIALAGKQEHAQVDSSARVAEILQRTKAAKRKTYRLPRIAVAACIAAVVLLSGNVLTLSAYGVNVLSAIVQFTKDAVKFDFNQQEQEEVEIELPITQDDPYGLRAECEQYGLSPLLPSYLPEGYELARLNEINIKDYCKGIDCLYQNGKQTINIIIEEYFESLPDSFGFPNDKGQLDELNINSRPTFILRKDDRYSTVFERDLTLYCMHTENVDYDTVVKILESYQ
ncbi:MAG: DUF4367 domain-containing protein [Acetanaerobacterium sp.]